MFVLFVVDVACNALDRFANIDQDFGKETGIDIDN